MKSDSTWAPFYPRNFFCGKILRGPSSGAICPCPSSPWWNKEHWFWSLRGLAAGEHSRWKRKARKSMKLLEHLDGLTRASLARVCRVAAELRTPCPVCPCASHQDRWVWSSDPGGRRSLGRIGRGVGGARPSAPGPHPGHRGRCRPPSSGAGRLSLASPRRCPASGASPPPTPGSRDCLGAAGGGETKRGAGGRSACGCAERGRRSARLGGRGRVCAPGRRATGRETRARSAPPGFSRGASVAAAQTHTHRAPPSAPRAPAAPAGRSLASGSGIQRQVQGWCGAQRTS